MKSAPASRPHLDPPASGGGKGSGRILRIGGEHGVIAMHITHTNDPADITARYGDAHRPENDLPWQSNKLGVTVFVSDQSGCVFLIMRHDPALPPSRLVRAFFRDAPDATVAVVECSGEGERTALLTPIQNTIATSLENEAPDRSAPPVKTIDLDVPPPRMTNQPDAIEFHAVRSFYLSSERRFLKYLEAAAQLDRNADVQRAGIGVTMYTASNASTHSVILIRLDTEQSRRHPAIRQIFSSNPDAFGWVSAFDDWFLRDTFALGLQHRICDTPSDDGPEDVFQWPVNDGPRGGGDAGVPALTVRPKPTRSGSDAKELPEDDEPEVYSFGPQELAETPSERELVPARVETGRS